ncbi:MAG: sigma-54 interaction domain-containing protein [Saezia sp.]
MGKSHENVEELKQEVQALQKQVEALRIRALVYEKSIDAIPDGFFIVDRQGFVIEMNQAYCDFLGFERENVIGKPVHSIIYNSKMLDIMEHNTVEQDSFHQYESHQKTASGERLVAVSRLPVSDQGEVIAGVALIKFSHYTIELAHSLKEMEKEIEYYRKELRKHGFLTFDDLPSASSHYEQAKRTAQRFSDSSFPILLLGETGSGKEVFAHAIHHASERRTGPFISVNCASIPSELIESELFGYVDGAFTGSRRGGKKGKFEMAHHGTLFLDEIGDMPLIMQSKLLRVLQSQEVEKLGAEHSVPIDVRIIAATHQDLYQKVLEGTFREDLLYRLDVLQVNIPPLRERVEDIHILSMHFLNELNDEYKRKKILAPQTVQILINYSWPGNIRELRNAIGRGFMMVDEGSIILPKHLPAKIFNECSSTPDESFYTQEGMKEGKKPILAQAEREVIIKCLQQYKGNLSKTADALGIHRTTLYAKLEALNISAQSYRDVKA